MKILDIIKEEKVLELKYPKFIRLRDPKTFEAYQRLLKSKAAKLTSQTNALSAGWKKAWPTKSLWIIRILGIASAVSDLYVELGYAQEDYVAGKISQDDLQKYRQWAFGKFIVDIGAVVAASLANAMTVGMIAKWIIRLAGAASGSVTAGASIAAVIASEAFFQWLAKWLSSSIARDWFTSYLVKHMLENAGAIPEGAWSALVGYYNAGKAGDKAKDKVAPGPAGQKPNDPAAAPVGGAATKPAASIWNQTTPTINNKEYMGLSPFQPVGNPNPVR